MTSEALGRWSAGIMFVGFNVAFFPMHLSGLQGMPRRVYTYQTGLGLDVYNFVSTIGAFTFAIGVVLSLVNFLRSVRRGAPAGNDPWAGDTLEWSESSPPEDAQFGRLPAVRSRHPLWDQATLLPVPDDDRAVTAAVRATDRRPGRWRGALVVGVIDGRPLGVAHLPRRSIWPFVLSVGFLFLFTAALLDHPWIALAGVAISAVGLGGWFWPQATETVAIHECNAASSPPSDEAPGVWPDDEPEPVPGGTPLRLPLVIGDRYANGYWGTWVFVLILATAFATFLSGHFYLGTGDRALPAGERLPPLRFALVAAVVAVASAVATRFATLATDRRAGGTRALSLAAAGIAQLVLIGVTFASWRELQLTPSQSAYASGVLGLVGFSWFVALTAGVMLLTGLLWALRSARDPRGRAVALNASLVSYFSSATWLAVLVVVYLWPRTG
jgi:cytochrome c oxidase subunit I+III